MILYLLRHGEATPLGEQGIRSDAERPLTDRGRADVQALADRLAALDHIPGVVLCSPLVRARQTADALVSRWENKPAIQECAALALDGDRDEVMAALRKLGAGSVMLVGHQPDIGKMTAWLIGSRKARIDFATGAVACLETRRELEKGTAALVWMVTPAWAQPQK